MLYKIGFFIFHYVLDVLFKFWFQYMMLKWCKTWIFYYKVHNAFDFTKDVNKDQSKLQCGAWDIYIYIFFCLLFFERFWFLTLCFNFFCQLHESYNCSLFCLLEHGEMHENTFLFWFWLNLKSSRDNFLEFLDFLLLLQYYFVLLKWKFWRQLFSLFLDSHYVLDFLVHTP